PQPAAQERPRGARRDQAGPPPAPHPRRHHDQLRRREGHPGGLRPVRELLRHQAGRPRPVHPRGQVHRALLVQHREAARGVRKTLSRQPPASASQECSPKARGSPRSCPGAHYLPLPPRPPTRISVIFLLSESVTMVARTPFSASILLRVSLLRPPSMGSPALTVLVSLS